jgi:hypothetical protein
VDENFVWGIPLKLTLNDLNNSIAAINALADAKPKSAKVAYKLGRIVKSARDEAQLLADSQTKLLEEHGNPVADQPGQWQIDPDTRTEFNTAWSDLLTAETTVWGDPFPLSEIEGQLDLTVDQYSRLWWLFVDDLNGEPGVGQTERDSERTRGKEYAS